MRKDFTVLFTCVGRRVELLQAFRAAAQREDCSLHIIGTDSAHTAPALTFCDRAYIAPAISDESYIPALLEICERHRVDVLIPTIDTDLLPLSQNADAFEQRGVRVLVSEESAIAVCTDKLSTYKFLRSCGVATPETSEGLGNQIPGFPCFIKPRKGSASIGAHRADNAQQLEHYASSVQDPLVQALIEGAEFTVDVFCDFQGRPIHITQRERLKTRSGEVAITKISDDDVAREECLRIVRRLRPVGPITIQFIRQAQTGVNHYIEINPRFGGGAPLSMKAGAVAAQSLLRLLGGLPLPAPEAVDCSVGDIYSRYDESVRVTARIHRVTGIRNLHGVVSAYDTVLFDLDDTLYNEIDYVRGGFEAVAKQLPAVAQCYEKLMSAFQQRLPAIDAVLRSENLFSDALKERCLAAYREHVPRLRLNAGAEELLCALRRQGKKIGVITDGRPLSQRLKIRELGLDQWVHEVIVTDELAGVSGKVGHFRKPNDIAFRVMLLRLRAAGYSTVYVADNPAKDFHPCRTVGIDGVHLQNPDGLYR